MRAFVAAVLLCTPTLAGCVGEGPAEGEAGDGSVPTWHIVDLDGVTHGTETVQGNVTVLFFMATWCTSCQSKAGILRDLHAAYEAEPVQFLTVSQDPQETAEDLRDWKAEYRQPWPHAVDEDARVAQIFGITLQSSFVVLDPTGAVHRKWSYPGPSEEGLRATLHEALSAA